MIDAKNSVPVANAPAKKIRKTVLRDFIKGTSYFNDSEKVSECRHFEVCEWPLLLKNIRSVRLTA